MRKEIAPQNIEGARITNKFGIFLKELFRLLGRHVIGNGIRVILYRCSGLSIGHHTQISGALQIMDGAYIGLIKIGNYCAISPRVSIAAGSSPPIFHPKMPPESYPVKFGKITIEDGAWVGTGAVIMPGVTIGKHAIVGSNSVVAIDVPPYAIVAGSPAKQISWRNVSGEQVYEAGEKID